MLQKHNFQSATLPDAQIETESAAPAPVRHGRLFELLRHDDTGAPTEDQIAGIPHRPKLKLSDDDMLAIQSTALNSLQPRVF